MYPVFANLKNSGYDGPGLGMVYEDFVKCFLDVCKEHVQDQRAQGFAFLFYEQGGPLSVVLQQADGFRILNEASGKDMTIFYLTDPHVLGDPFKKFNETFMKTLGIKKQAKPPCIVFFRVDANEVIDDIAICKLDEGMPDYMVVEQARRYVLETIGMWDSQGNLSALNPVPLMKLTGALSRVAAPRPF